MAFSCDGEKHDISSIEVIYIYIYILLSKVGLSCATCCTGILFCCLIFILTQLRVRKKNAQFSIANVSLHCCLFSVIKSTFFVNQKAGMNMICLLQTQYPVCAP